MPGRAALLLALPLASCISIKPAEQETCAPLRDHQSYSSVKVSIGNPPQSFDLVADTGSNNCIVKSCACKTCPADWDRNCFTGTNKSKTFELPTFALKDGQPVAHGAQSPATTVLSFGSGEIAAKIASDEVQIGAVKAYLKNGVLLMVDHALKLQGEFEGILGLGRPSPKAVEKQGGIKVPGFLESAHVRRFSMCFNREADGVLGLHTPPHPTALRSVGKVHWGLDFHGISIGQREVKVGICDPSSKKEGMETVCGLIPDSGTTLIAANEQQILKVYEALCREWPRCQKAHEDLKKDLEKLKGKGFQLDPRGVLSNAQESLVMGNRSLMKYIDHLGSPFGAGERLMKFLAAPPKPKPGASEMADSIAQETGGELPQSLTLQLLLERCADWMEGVDLDQEVPELGFHVGDLHGKKDKLSLKPRSYILSREMVVDVPAETNVFGFPLRTVKKEKRQVCLMAFSPIDYKTELNGDVWIMGTPLFYEFTAHYDRGNGPEEEVSMGFTRRDQQACGQCSSGEIVRPSATLISQKGQRSESGTALGLGTLNKLAKNPVVMNITSFRSI